MVEGLTPADAAAVRAQLGRPPRAARRVAHRCGCGLPDVVETAPRLPDGTPFPTLYYLTCPRARSAVGRLESSGLMREMTARLREDPQLAAAYRAAYEDYLRRRDAIEPLGTAVAAGGMPDRVKCLHVHLAHTLAAGPGVNPFGDEVRALLDDWGNAGPCVTVDGVAPVGGTSRRVAAIDCGTNSIRLLVAEAVDGRLRDLVREMRIVRLGEGVDATGRLSPAALHRTFAALDDYAATIRNLGVAAADVRMAATSATRDASNREEFVAGVRQRLGVTPEVLTGDEEAALSFAGAASALPPQTPAPWLVADIGGGSTELVLGSASGVTAACSVDIGCVRITERRLPGDPPSPDMVAAAIEDIDMALRRAAEAVPLASAATVVGLAGSVTTVAAIALGLPAYDPTAIHGSIIKTVDVHRISGQLLSMTRAERAALPVMHPGRVDVIGAGALILDRLLLAAGADAVIAGEHDILDGLALSVLTR